MKDIRLFDGNVFSVPDECYEITKKYIERINQIDCIRESYATVLPYEDEDDYKVNIDCVIEDCSDKWIERVYDIIGISTCSSDLLAGPVQRSDFERGLKITEGLKHLRVKVQDSTWHGFTGDIPRCDMVDIGGSVVVASYKEEKLRWYRDTVVPAYDEIEKVFVVGSAIRNWCTSESDIDLLVVCDNGIDCDRLLSGIDERFTGAALDDILVCSREEFDTAVSGFIKVAKEEGVLLYAR